MNEPEKYRKVEKDAQSMSAKFAAEMLRHPRARWFLKPFYRLMKWVERQSDEALKDEGWR